MVDNSILDSVKKPLNLPPDYAAFDEDVILHINSVLADLNQLGIGPAEGFMINDNTQTWDEFISGDLLLNNVKSYVFLRVKMLFDPPENQTLINAFGEQIKQFEWRINVTREQTQYVDPNTTI